jgi:GNAT superfamily N-acetyltransferase
MAIETHSFTVRPVDGTDLDLRDAVFTHMRAAGAHDLPDFPPACRRRFDTMFTHPRPGHDVLRWAAVTADGDVAGLLTIDLFTIDNLDSAELEISVLPAYRRRGLGRDLYRRGVDLLRERGRRRIFAMVPVALPGTSRDEAGARFAEAMGMTNALDDVRRRLDVTALDRAVLDTLADEARTKADGYTLLRWQRTPEEYLDDIAYLDSRLSTDAPMGDLVFEPQKIDAGRLRADDEVREAYGQRTFSTAARHDASGRLVAWTFLQQDHDVHDQAWQGITLVRPDHRGHRLGMLVKVENLRYALDHLPRLHHIDTWNAASNTHMVAINEALGFAPVDRWLNLQHEI